MNINVSKKAGQKGGSERRFFSFKPSGRTALQAKLFLLPAIPGLQPGCITHGIAFQAKILLLQCALHRLLRPHCVGWLTAKLVP